ncbi:hypothetical protein ACJMK2_000307 [Sinanodonta woodiana]|uniref:C-type lectin domain-containing protein n=1 Tax=Sinanodonta woodiana TaxID=1069815 RepID=A0ABD3XPD3_SINWO
MRMCLASMSFKRGLPPGEEIQQGWKYYTKPRQCDGDYVYYQPLGLCYKIHVEQKSFSDAMAVCESEGAKLFIIEDEREFQYIKQVLMGVAATVGIGPLIGLRAIGAGREWTWWNGQNLTYLAWIIGQPDNFLNNEACVQLNSYHGFKYNDVSCAYALSYICQRYL